MTNGHENAYPLEYLDDRDVRQIDTGLTKRELFAAMAMQGILSQSHSNWNLMEAHLSERSVRHADALIAELSK